MIEFIQFHTTKASAISDLALQYTLRFVEASFDTSKFCPTFYRSAQITLPECLKKSVVKRQAEFLAGRIAARHALEQLNIKVSDIPIGNHRSPVWPEAVNASITHTNNTVAVIAGLKSETEYLGLDQENWLTLDTAEQIMDKVLCPDEIQLLYATGLTLNKLVTLAFSAKESLFKALYPRVKSYFDFDAARLVKISLESASFTLELAYTLHADLKVGACFCGKFDLLEDGIRSYIFHPSKSASKT